MSTATVGRAIYATEVDRTGLQQGLAANEREAQSSLGRMRTSFASVGRELTGAGRALSGALTLPILGAGAAIVKVGSDFESILNTIVGLTDVTRDEIDGVKRAILALGQEVGKTPQELAEGFYFLASAGFDTAEAMEVLRIAAMASAAGLGTTQDVSKVLGLILNAYGKENISAARAADILTNAVKNGTAEADAFAGVLGRVVPTAATLGVGFDQVAAALAAMTLTGLSAEEGATSLNQVFVSLLNPTREAEDAMLGMGLSAAGLRTQLREEGLLAVLRTLEERFAGNTEAASKVFGNVRALRGVLSLLTLDSEQLNGVFAEGAAAQGDLARGYAETEGSAREFGRAQAQLDALLIQLSEDVLPIVVRLLAGLREQLADVQRWWSSLDQGTKDFIVTAAMLLAVIGPLLLILGMMALAVSALAGVFALLWTAMLGPIGVIAALVIGVGLLLHHFGLLDDVIQTAMDYIGDFGYRLGGVIGLVTDLAGAFVDLADAALRALAGDFVGAAAAAERAMDRFASAGENMARAMGDANQRMRDEQEHTAAVTARTTADFLQRHREMEAGVYKTAESTDDATDQMVAAFEDAADDSKEPLKEIKRGLSDITGALQKLGDGSTNYWRDFKKATKDGTENPEERIKALGKQIEKLDKVDLASLPPGALATWVKVRGDAQTELDGLTSFMDNKGEIISDIIPDALETARREGRSEWQDIFGDAQSYGRGIVQTTGRSASFVTGAWTRQMAILGNNNDREWRKTAAETRERLDRIRAIARNAGEDAALALARGLASQARAVRIATSNLAYIVQRGLLLSSPAKEGPWSEKGGPQAWMAHAVDLMVGGFRDRVQARMSDMRTIVGEMAGVGGQLAVPGLLAVAGTPAVAGAGSSVHNAYQIEINVPPGADLTQVGRVTVEAIQAYERSNGRDWRREV